MTYRNPQVINDTPCILVRHRSPLNHGIAMCWFTIKFAIGKEEKRGFGLGWKMMTNEMIFVSGAYH